MQKAHSSELQQSGFRTPLPDRHATLKSFTYCKILSIKSSNICSTTERVSFWKRVWPPFLHRVLFIQKTPIHASISDFSISNHRPSDGWFPPTVPNKPAFQNLPKLQIGLPLFTPCFPYQHSPGNRCDSSWIGLGQTLKVQKNRCNCSLPFLKTASCNHGFSFPSLWLVNQAALGGTSFFSHTNISIFKYQSQEETGIIHILAS